MGNEIYVVKDLKPDHVDQMLVVWEDAVRKTHEFLSEEDILAIKKSVPSAFVQVEHVLLMFDENGEVKAFLGAQGEKIEMLFVSPSNMREGCGKALVAYAICELKTQFVDVNEQNHEAFKFYEHVGFEVFDRSELDDEGRPFPILHMKYCAKKGEA